MLVVVNSQIYGGSGGPVGVFSLAPGATEIALHEMGHTAFGLADEYAYYAGGVEPDHDHHPPADPLEPNVTTNTDRPSLKWNWAVDPATALPTMSNPDCASVDSRPSPVPVGTVGLFEGAHYYHCGAYRPEYDCKMRALSVPFCRVCQHAIATRIAAPVVATVPIGMIDTPPPSATVAGEVAFTGWAVDDSGITDVRIYRSPAAGEPTDPSGLIFLGTAAMIEGARPDIVAAFPQYPGVSRAGWGFMILTNMLPNGGNGTFTLHAVARSHEWRDPDHRHARHRGRQRRQHAALRDHRHSRSGRHRLGHCRQLRLGAHAAAENDSARRLDNRRLHRRRDGRPSVSTTTSGRTSRGCSRDMQTRTAQSASTSSTRPA